MLVELADDLLDGVNDDEIQALELLLHARRLGYHLLTGSRDVFAKLPQVVNLSDSAVTILGRARRRQMEKAQLIESTNHRLRVARQEGPKTDLVNGVIIVTLRLSHFRELCAPAETVVLGENIDDAYLGVAMADVFRVSEGLSTVAMRFRPDGGGGSTTATSFRQYRDDPRLCICVVDSDRRCPTARLGNTAAMVIDEMDVDKPWAIVVSNRYRSAENALSTRMIQAAVSNAPELLAKIPAIEELDRVAPEIRNYCDLKNGTRLKDVFALPADPCGRYWENRLGALGGLASARNDCITQGSCSDQDYCDCWIMPKMGDNLLRVALEELERMTPHKMAEALCEVTRPHWMDLGQTVFSWVCGTRRTIV